MFNRVIDIVVQTHLSDVIEKKIIEKATQPSAFKNIKQQTACPMSKFASKFIKANIKSCDGVNALFEKSLVVKSPADFHFVANGDTFQSSSASRLYNVREHEHEQIQVTPFKFYPKIMFPAFVHARTDAQFLLHKAYYHAQNKRVYPSGVISGLFNPNVIFELEPNTEDFVDYLEPLLYLTVMADKKIKVHYELISEQQFAQMQLKFEKRRFYHHSVLEW